MGDRDVPRSVRWRSMLEYLSAEDARVTAVDRCKWRALRRYPSWSRMICDDDNDDADDDDNDDELRSFVVGCC